MVSFIAFFTFLVLIIVIITNQPQPTATVDEDIEQGDPSHSIGGEETPIQKCPLPPRPPTERPSSSLTPPETQVPRNSPNRRRSNVNPEASSSSSGQDNAFLNLAPRHFQERRNTRLVPEPHQMDAISWVSLGYCLSAGLEFNSIYAQVNDPRNLSPRFILISMLTMNALCLLIGANAVLAPGPWLFSKIRNTGRGGPTN
ncbi:unnamed protein product [Arabidopsis lyrata]|nr:unnamed protein product [Arabidopsis lyrata]